MKRSLIAAMLCALAWTGSAAPILDNFDDPVINPLTQTWINLDAPFTGDGQLFRKLYPARENPKLFYRVEVVAP
jgi:hypothetical protein